MTFLKKGAAAKAAVQAEEVKFEERRAEMNRMRRFYIGYNKDTQITFLDGKLDEDGMLDIPRFYEHSIQVGSDWKHYVCTAEIDQSQPCPMCEAGNKPSLVGVMTVIDHSEYTVQKGPNAGKVYKNQRRLFVAKEGTLKDLNKLAAKPERNGLAGCTFDVSRGGENTRDPNVGKTFDFVVKNKTLAAIAEKYEPQDRGRAARPVRRRGRRNPVPAARKAGRARPRQGARRRRLRKGRQRSCKRAVKLTANSPAGRQDGWADRGRRGSRTALPPSLRHGGRRCLL